MKVTFSKHCFGRNEKMKNSEVDYYQYTSSDILFMISWKTRKTIFSLFMKHMTPAEFSTILDVGVTPNEGRGESNFFERLYPYKNRITAASIEDAQNIERRYGVRFVRLKVGEGLPFKDNEFDIGFSNAVVEHVGSREKQRAFIEEIVRVSRKCFVSVPDRLFPIEHHTALPFIYYLPQTIHRKLLRTFGKVLYSTEETLNLLTQRDLNGMIPSACRREMISVRIFMLPSNIVAVIDKEEA